MGPYAPESTVVVNFNLQNNVVTGLGSHCILGFTDSRGSHFIQGGVTVC